MVEWHFIRIYNTILILSFKGTTSSRRTVLATCSTTAGARATRTTSSPWKAAKAGALWTSRSRWWRSSSWSSASWPRTLEQSKARLGFATFCRKTFLLCNKKILVDRKTLAKSDQNHISGNCRFGHTWVGICDIELFVFHHRFCITRSKFPKFESGQNAAEKFWFGIIESKILQNLMKVDEIIV